MDTASLPKVECAILHNQFNPLNNEVLFEHVRRLASEHNFAAEVQMMDTSDESSVHVHVGGHRVVVSQVPYALDPSGFKDALTTPYTKTIHPTAHEVVHRHNAHSVVTIARGLFDVSPEAALFKDAAAASAGFKTDQEVLRAMTFCRELVKLVIGNNPAAALHWKPSDNLFTQEFFERNCEGDMLLLNVRPFLASTTGRLEEGLPLGMVLTGSQWLVGRVIEFEEAAVSFPWLMEAAIAFITICQSRGSMLANMETYGQDGADWRVGVMHEASASPEAWDKVKLVPVHVPEFGILGETDSRFTTGNDNIARIRDRSAAELNEVNAANENLYKEVSYLNPEDSMDLAILERLRKRQTADHDAEVQPIPEVSEPETNEVAPIQEAVVEAPPVAAQPLEPWTGSNRKADLESLRALAKVGLNSEAEEKVTEPEEKSSLMGKLGGMFGRR